MQLTTSHIKLEKLRFHAFHGVMPQEATVGNDYEVCLDIKADLSQAMTTDKVEHTVNYATLYEIADDVMSTPSALLENVCYRIADKVFNEFPSVEEATVSVEKLNPPFGADCHGAKVEMHFAR